MVTTSVVDGQKRSFSIFLQCKNLTLVTWSDTNSSCYISHGFVSFFFFFFINSLIFSSSITLSKSSLFFSSFRHCLDIEDYLAAAVIYETIGEWPQVIDQLNSSPDIVIWAC